MKSVSILFLVIAALVPGCGASQPPPIQQMADVQSATRSATELGANTNPAAQLHLKLAEEQMAQAKNAMDKDDNDGAERLLVRANADAELAVALMREHEAKQTATKASEQSATQRFTNEDQGAKR